ncbi:glycosyltransferase family 9 protein [Segetibacter aerophilus]|uniref:Glycosyl transferase family 9 n=1 Tax=Segetibacter aerophilus TaxID=670293 RepID=A0A512B7S0_9BACT|nr:glycosyltransferase family 9 protein [Segetibacter aerophilus]GEO08004.1 glycosyl transferase family 9 [Segetibacter aerophilus]
MIKKIAVLRANALGDYIFVLPALQALRETFADAEIVLLGRQWHKEYLAMRPGPVDRVVVVPLYPGISEREGYIPDEEELSKFFSEMQNESFDLAFQLHGGGRNSNPFLLRLGAKTTVGLKTPDAAALDINVPYVYYFNETMRYLEVVGRVGAKTRNIQPSISVIEKDIEEARQVVKNPAAKPVAIIHPGASDIRRRWPGENFARIADHLAELGFHVCITGLAWEREIVDAVINNVVYKDCVQDLSDKLSLGGTTGLLSFADIIISNDTGPLHVARALQKPSVGIFWCANIINAAPMTTTLNRNLLSWTLNCPLCDLSSFKFNETASTCDHNTSMVADVTIEEVKEAIDEVLDTALSVQMNVA